MPITSSAKKAMRASLRKQAFNFRRKDKMKELIKRYRTLVEAGKKDEAISLLPELTAAIDKAAKRGVIKKNNASRKKSRFARKLV